MNIIEKFKTFLPETDKTVEICWHEPESGTHDDASFFVMSRDFRAFVESHERLLKAGRQFIEKGTWYNVSRGVDMVSDTELDLLREAIEAAEKLTEGK